MKKKMWMAMGAMSAAMLMSAAAGAAENGGVEVVASPNSPTGYTVNFAYHDEEATNVRLVGGFALYQNNDLRLFSGGYGMDKLNGYHTVNEDGSAGLIGQLVPQAWTNSGTLRHIGDTSYTEDLTYDEETGMWTGSLNLPCASYLYQYSVSYDGGETYTSIADPENAPYINELGAEQTRSQFYVPYDADYQSPADDWSWLFPEEDEAKRGEIQSFTYAGAFSDEQPGIIYLPANYDPDRSEGYKVLYLSHGGGGDEGDWFYQGNACNIVDRLIDEGVCEDFVMVTMDNSVFTYDDPSIFGLNYDWVLENFRDYLIPYVEEHYNVVADGSGRALMGLSLGGRVTNEMYYKDPSLFGYYGILSAGEPLDFPENAGEEYQEANIFLAGGYADYAIMKGTSLVENAYYHGSSDRTLMGLADKLTENGVTYNNGDGIYVAAGSHDWFNWPQVLKKYVSEVLWK